MKQPIRAAIYCRVASPDQFSLDLQEQSVCEFAKAKGYEISSITKEEYSGTTTMSRPGIQQVLDYVKNGTIDVLLTHNIDRIGRNTVEVVNFIRLLGEYGVTVETVKPSFPNIGQQNLLIFEEYKRLGTGKDEAQT